MPTDLGSLRVAIVHDWLVVSAGAERVLDEMLAVFPQAELFALICAMPGQAARTYRGRPVRTSFLQRLPFGVSHYRQWFPLHPTAIESLDLAGYDLVISSSHSVAKGVVTRSEQLHVSYCYSPMRYAWDLREQYLEQAGLHGATALVARALIARSRRWDLRTTSRVDAFLTLSRHIAARIDRCYGRESVVVYPPVDLDAFPLSTAPRAGFVTASRLVPYKLVPMIVRAFAGMPDLALTVIGDGPDLEACRRAAAGHPQIRILGHQPQSVLRDELTKAEAFVFAAQEDFGIAPLEAQACGTPVIAFGEGGARETIIDGTTGAFFDRQDEATIRDAVRRFRNGAPISPDACRMNAERFAAVRFRTEFTTAIESALATHAVRSVRSARAKAR